MRGRLGLVVALALGILLAPVAAEGQQAEKVRRIAYLSAPSREAAERWVQVFQQALRELGWVEGQNIVIEFRWAEGKYDRLPDLAAELVRLKVEVIVVPATVAALAAKNATKTIPIVTVLANDPVGIGLVASLARPGGNITGLTETPGPEMFGKQLELLKEAVPKVSRVAVLGNPANPIYPLMLSETQVAARALGLELQLLEARSPKDFNSAFAAITRERAGALLVLADSMFFAHRTQTQTWRLRAACRRFPRTGNWWRPVASWPIRRIGPIYSGALPSMWIRSSKAPSPAICPWSSPRSSSSSSTSRPPRRSG